jgi:hypothetical protein
MARAAPKIQPMKLALAALALFSLAACDVGPPGKGHAPAAGHSGSVALGSTQDLPDWLFIARQRDCDANDCVGQVFFNQRTITRSANGTADIWIQTDHNIEQPYVTSDAGAVTRIFFKRERTHYRFKCNDNQFTIVERQIIGANETIAARDTYPEVYRTPVDNSLVPLIEPIACRGS